MKRVLCPKCDNYITFDETKYTEGQSLVFVCDHCKKQFLSIMTACPVCGKASVFDCAALRFAQWLSEGCLAGDMKLAN